MTLPIGVVTRLLVAELWSGHEIRRVGLGVLRTPEWSECVDSEFCELDAKRGAPFAAPLDLNESMNEFISHSASAGNGSKKNKRD